MSGDAAGESAGRMRVTNPPQVANLPHNLRGIRCFGKTKWHWAGVPAPRPLIRGRSLHTIDHENLYRALGRREFQPELLL